MFKTKQKMLIAFLFVIFLTVVYAGSFFARDVKVFYNGNEIMYDVPTKIISDYAMVPLSETLEVIYGRGTVFNPALMTSTFHANGHVYTHTIGSNILYIDSSAKTYDVPSLIAGNRALVPTKMIADITGCNVQWDPGNYHVLISKPVPVATPTPVVPTQAPTTPKPSVPAVVITADLNKSAITRGESVTVTIKTNSSANYVWVNDGSETIPAIFAWEGADGIKTWVLSYKATKNVNFSVSANTVNQIPGTAMKSMALAVSTPTPTPSPTPAATATIYSAVPNRTDIEPGGSVYFTIRTNSATNYVWLEYSGGTSSATYNSMDVSGIKTWTATIYPGVSQQVNIRAGTAQSSWNAAYTSQYITVGGGYAAITGGPYVSPQTIYPGQSTTITVNTNSTTNYVWADIGDGGNHVYFSSINDYYGGKTWTATVPLYSSRTIYVYAGTYSGAGNTSATVNVTVQGQNPEVFSVSNSPTDLRADTTVSQDVLFTVRTNYDVAGVYAAHNGNTAFGTLQSQSGNEKVWYISMPITWGGVSTYETVSVSYQALGTWSHYRSYDIPVRQP